MGDAADRMRRLRARRREGVRVLPVEIGIEVVETLLEIDYLQVEDVGDLTAVATAVARFVEDMTESVTRHEITLDTW